MSALLTPHEIKINVNPKELGAKGRRRAVVPILLTANLSISVIGLSNRIQAILWIIDRI
jgi:hypothetical protein